MTAGAVRTQRPAAFIDRDGVINVERAYVYRIADFAYLPGSVEAMRKLQQGGYRLIVITNQSGIARGLYSEHDYRLLEAHMRSSLADAGVVLDAVQFCPHLPDAQVPQYRCECDCRKPGPGMIRSAAKLLDVDLAHSILVGDRAADVTAGRAAGVGRCFLVRSGLPLSEADAASADAVFEDLAQCAAHVLGCGA